ncbi:MAG: fatty acid desaturase [Myxococcota bacterium]
MATTAESLPEVQLAPAQIAGIWVRHLTSLLLPVNALAFLWTGPHPWYIAPLFMMPVVVAHYFDCRQRVEQRQPVESLPAWPFDALVYALAALQIVVVVSLVHLFTLQGAFSLDMIMVFIVVGGNSGFSIITAHELIHRKKPWEQWLGRVLLGSVLYEHFYTEHLRGHHVRVGTPDDPATARFGEDYESFFKRTVPAQFKSAWRLEKRRLGDADMSNFDRRMLRNRIVHGLVLEWGFAFAVFAAFGFAAFAAFVLQAWSAVRLLEAVNYFEHWGLRRASRRVQPVDSWDTHSWFTYYGLTGLSRHADHHAWPARPFQQLRVWDEAPILPYGYVGMVDQVLEKNDEFQQEAAAELARRRLGPFVDEGLANDPDSAARQLAEAQAEERRGPGRTSWLARAWTGLPLWLRRVLFLGGLVTATAVGVQWESGADSWLTAERWLLHAWILAVFTAVIVGRRRLQDQIGNEVVAWAASFVVLVGVGWLTSTLVG